MFPDVMKTYADQFHKAEGAVRLQLLYLLFVPLFLAGFTLYTLTSY